MDQTTTNTVQNETDQVNPSGNKPGMNYILVGLIFILILLLAIVISFALGKQTGENPVSNNNNTPTAETPDNNPSDAEEDCVATFTSKYLVMNFEYDECVWEINERLVTPEQGTYSTITAEHISGEELLISAQTLGMGGGYPTCSNAKDIKVINDELIRINTDWGNFGYEGNNYFYWNGNNDFAIKGYSGEYGNEKFNTYFTILDPADHPDSNVCWRSFGVNNVSILNPTSEQTEVFQRMKDIHLLIQGEIINDTDFLEAADSLAGEIYSRIGE